MKFKEFLITEQREYLVDKINDILTGIHEILSSGKQISARQYIRNAEYVANQIRKMLHAAWPRSEHKYLKTLQKCGVALLKSVEEKGDLPETFNSVRVELEKLTGKLGQPVNQMGTAEEEKPPEVPQPPNPPQAATPAPQSPAAPGVIQ